MLYITLYNTMFILRTVIIWHEHFFYKFSVKQLLILAKKYEK